MAAKICLTCSEPYTDVRANKNYCSNACRQKAYRQSLKDMLEDSLMEEDEFINNSKKPNKQPTEKQSKEVFLNGKKKPNSKNLTFKNSQREPDVFSDSLDDFMAVHGLSDTVAMDIPLENVTNRNETIKQSLAAQKEYTQSLPLNEIILPMLKTTNLPEGNIDTSISYQLKSSHTLVSFENSVLLSSQITNTYLKATNIENTIFDSICTSQNQFNILYNQKMGAKNCIADNTKKTVESVTYQNAFTENVTDCVTDKAIKNENVTNTVTDLDLQIVTNRNGVTDNVTESVIKNKIVTDNVTDWLVKSKFVTDCVTDKVLKHQNVTDNPCALVKNNCLNDLNKANTNVNAPLNTNKKNKIDSVNNRSINSNAILQIKNKILANWQLKQADTVKYNNLKNRLNGYDTVHSRFNNYSKSVSDFITALIDKDNLFLDAFTKVEIAKKSFSKISVKILNTHPIKNDGLNKIDSELEYSKPKEFEHEFKTVSENEVYIPIEKSLNQFIATQTPYMHFESDDLIYPKTIYNATKAAIIDKNNPVPQKSISFYLRHENPVFKALHLDKLFTKHGSNTFNSQASNSQSKADNFIETSNTKTKAPLNTISEPMNSINKTAAIVDEQNQPKASTLKSQIPEFKTNKEKYTTIRCDWMDDIFIEADENGYNIKNQIKKDSYLTGGANTLVYQIYFEIIHRVLDLTDKQGIPVYALIDITNLLTRLICSSYFDGFYKEFQYYPETIKLIKILKKKCLENSKNESFKFRLDIEFKRTLIAQIYELSYTLRRNSDLDLSLIFDDFGI